MSKQGWRLNGTAPADIAHLLGGPINGRIQVLYRCPDAGNDLCLPIRLDGGANPNLECPLGRSGPLCQSCGQQQTASSESDQCQPCTRTGAGSVLACGASLLVAAALITAVLLVVSAPRQREVDHESLAAEIPLLQLSTELPESEAQGPSKANLRMITLQLTLQSLRIMIS